MLVQTNCGCKQSPFEEPVAALLPLLHRARLRDRDNRQQSVLSASRRPSVTQPSCHSGRTRCKALAARYISSGVLTGISFPPGPVAVTSSIAKALLSDGSLRPGGASDSMAFRTLSWWAAAGIAGAFALGTRDLKAPDTAPKTRFISRQSAAHRWVAPSSKNHGTVSSFCPAFRLASVRVVGVNLLDHAARRARES